MHFAKIGNVFYFIIIIQSIQNVKTLHDADNNIKITNANKKNFPQCPNMIHRIFNQSAPIGDTKSGNFTQFKDIPDIETCVKKCCLAKSDCNVAFVFDDICYHVKCTSNELCLPKKRQNKGQLQMVLVNPVADFNTSPETVSQTWLNILKATNYIDNNHDPSSQQSPDDDLERNNFWKTGNYHSRNEPPFTIYDEDMPLTPEKRLNELLKKKLFANAAYDHLNNDPQSESQFLPDESDLIQSLDGQQIYPGSMNIFSCDLNIEPTTACPMNEECVKLIPKSRSGICRCLDGYKRDKIGKCLQLTDMDYAADTIVKKILNNNRASIISPDSSESEVEKLNENLATTKAPLKKLIVSVVSKVVQLPDKEVTLAAYTTPDEQTSGDSYKYSWTLISQPNGAVNGTITDQAKDKVKLSNLSEGVFEFKVSVTGNGSYGEAITNVTVLPAKRINKLPQVIIIPKFLIIKPPNSKAILDGSTSSDDDKIVSWHWDLVEGPIDYKPNLTETSTLQLSDLDKPGNYTFKLTIRDSDNAENSTIATISVQKVTDYPPEANAGTDVILYLPHNNVTLNGTLSKDDREIVSWEWTNVSKEGKAVDMQNTRTPYLQLSNLELGFYTFVLKVMDASNQTSSAKVNVFVKPPSNLPPVANAGVNTTVNLPQTWIVLNASQSTADIHITNYAWKQITGPNNAVILKGNESIANATSLTVGQYIFEVLVTDDNKNTGKANVGITVVQERNLPPKADAGGDQTLTLPLSAIYLNGSKSSDDLRVVKYLWTRNDSGLAFGTIIGDSDHEQVLILTDLIPGRYAFTLTVYDEQGLFDSQSVSVVLNPDPLIMHLVEITLTIGISTLTKFEYDSIVQKIALLIGDVKIHVRELIRDPKSNEAILVFYVEKKKPNGKNHIMPGIEVEKILKEKFWLDATLLGSPFTDARTRICQNKCSDHGLCNSVTRSCLCETFWMPSVFYFWGVDEANCDWSILYVFVGVLIGFLLLSGIFWGLSCVCKKRTKKPPRTRPKLQKYDLLRTHEDEMPSFTRGTSLTDSETDSDVLFENRSKPNGILRANGTSTKTSHSKYSGTRPGRRTKA